MNLRPEPTIFDVDLRGSFHFIYVHTISFLPLYFHHLDDSVVLTPLLQRLTGSPGLPILLIGGKSVGSLQQIRDLQQSGELQNIVTTAGAVVDGAKKKKKRH
jgi:hypothetical protein